MKSASHRTILCWWCALAIGAGLAVVYMMVFGLDLRLLPALYLGSRPAVYQVVFVKVHQAEGAAVQNILMRFAMARNLSVMLPYEDNVLSETERSLSLGNAGGKFDVLCSDAVYNATSIAKYFRDDAVRVTIIREPMRQAVSSLRYYGHFFPSRALQEGLRKHDHDPVLGFLRHPEDFHTGDSNPLHSILNNRMSLDLGFDTTRFEEAKSNEIKIRDFLGRLQSEFDLVLISDHFDESMVLLRRYLGWSMKEILYIKINEESFASDSVWHRQLDIDSDTYQTFRQWNAIDYALYDHFLPIFWDKVMKQRGFREEVRLFRHIKKKVLHFCYVGNENSWGSVLHVPKSAWSSEFNISRADCKMMMASEREITRMARIKQTGQSAHFVKTLTG